MADTTTTEKKSSSNSDGQLMPFKSLGEGDEFTFDEKKSEDFLAGFISDHKAGDKYKRVVPGISIQRDRDGANFSNAGLNNTWVVH